MKHLGKSILACALCFVVVLSGCSGTVSSETAQSMSVSQSTENVVAPGNYDEHFDIDLMSYFVMDVSPDDEIIQYLNDKSMLRLIRQSRTGTIMHLHCR